MIGIDDYRKEKKRSLHVLQKKNYPHYEENIDE
jgi:hypothetical protein